MQVVLWDTRQLDVSKDFAGGMGVGQYPGYWSWRTRLLRHLSVRDCRPTALVFAYLAAIFRRLGHQVVACEDRLPPRADLYVFNPALMTLALEREMIQRVLADNPKARVLVVGTVASVLPEALADLNVIVVKGEAEQLLWRLDDVLGHPGAAVALGAIEDLDRLPPPDWAPFSPRRFRVGFDFWHFPTAYIQASRGCVLHCNYCPYILFESAVRFRSPDAVAEEMAEGIRRFGFRSFKFRDPLFGLNRKSLYRLAELIGRLPRKIQFSIETRIDLMRPEILRVLKEVGLTSITVGIETPDADILRRHHRVPLGEDRQRDFIALCRGMGIRTVAGFMIGFPDDTFETIQAVLHYAQVLGPTYANFNVVTPYPGTEFFTQMQDRIADFDYRHYTVYTPVMKYAHLTSAQVAQYHEWCLRRYYFRARYLRENAHLLWPLLQKFGLGREAEPTGVVDPAHLGPPAPSGTSRAARRR